MFPAAAKWTIPFWYVAVYLSSMALVWVTPQLKLLTRAPCCSPQSRPSTIQLLWHVEEPLFEMQTRADRTFTPGATPATPVTLSAMAEMHPATAVSWLS